MDKKIFSLFVFGLISLNALANDVYLFDFVKKEPYKTSWNKDVWQAVKNKKSSNFSWLNKANGVASPVEKVKINGSEYYKATVCQPHNCGDNIAYLIIDSKGVKAIQFLNDSPNKIERIYYGSPSREEEKFLLQWHEKDNQF